MGINFGFVSGAQAYGASTKGLSGNRRRHFLDSSNGITVARCAGGIGIVVDGLELIRPVECQWDASRGARSPAFFESGSGGDRRPLMVHRRNDCPCGTMRRGWRKKGDPTEPQDHALGRSRGGLTSKIHILCDRWGHPLHFHLTAGQIHESTVIDTLLTEADTNVFDSCGEPIAWPLALAGDKGYRADWIDAYLIDLGIHPVIPSKENEDRDARGIRFDRKAYRNRNIVERLIGWLKESRRIFSRFEKTAKNFAGMIRMAFIHRYLRLATE